MQRREEAAPSNITPHHMFAPPLLHARANLVRVSSPGLLVDSPPAPFLVANLRRPDQLLLGKPVIVGDSIRLARQHASRRSPRCAPVAAQPLPGASRRRGVELPREIDQTAAESAAAARRHRVHRQRVVDEHHERVARVLDGVHRYDGLRVELLVTGASHDPRPRLLRRRAKLFTLPFAPVHPQVTPAAVVLGVLQVQ